MIRWFVVALIMSSGNAFAQTASNVAAQTVANVANAVAEQCTAKASLYASDQACTTINIETGHTRVLRLDRQFLSVIIGDDKVADVHVQDTQTVLITARAKVEGRTNVVFLDDKNRPIYSAEVFVITRPDEAPIGRVFVFNRGKNNIHEYYPYACTGGTCARLKEEYVGERSKDIFIPGLRQPNQLNVNSNNIAGAGGASGSPGEPLTQ